MSKVDIDEIAKKNPRLAEGLRRADEMNGHQSHAGPKQPDGKTPHDRRKLSTIWADDIEINLDGGGLIDGLLGTAGMTVLYGDSGVGKTFVAIDIVLMAERTLRRAAQVSSRGG